MASPHQPGLIDTNVLIDASRGHPQALTFVSQASAAGYPDVSVVTAMELVRGARNRAELTTVQQTLGGYRVHPVTPTMSQTALSLMVMFNLQVRLGVSDALIAATALELGLPLYTLNVRHFQVIPGLTVLRPY